jgi:hypothetical protein
VFDSDARATTRIRTASALALEARDLGALLTPLSSRGVRRGVFPSALWFSSHLLCFEHLFLSSVKNSFRPRVHNARLTDAVNI